MNTVTYPVVSRDLIAVLQYRNEKIAKKLTSALVRILSAEAASTSPLAEIIGNVAPTPEVIPAVPLKCKHGLREDWCASCVMLSRSGKSEQRANSSFRFQSMRSVQVGTKNSTGCAHNGGFSTIFVRRAEAGTWITGIDGSGEDFLADDTGTISPIAPCGDEKKQRFTRCPECGKLRTRSQFEFCGETLLKNGPCKKAWLKKHPPACESHRDEPKSNRVTKEDVAWAERQSAFPHSQTMPRIRKHFCPHCIELVVTTDNSVLRTTMGMYLPIEHECGRHEVEGIPAVTKQNVANRPKKFRTEEASQSRFEEKSIVFVGDGAEIEGLDAFRYNPRPNHSDQREKDLMRWAQRSQVGVAVGPACLRCKAPITKRKGTKFCTEDCRKRQWEQTNTQGAN